MTAAALALALTLGQAQAASPAGETPPPLAPAQAAPPAGEPPPPLAPAQTASPAGEPPPSLAPAAPAAVPAGEPLELEQALATAAERNLDLKISAARLRQADELSWKAWSGYLPQLTALGTLTRNQYAAELGFSVYSAVRTREGAPGTPGNPDDPATIPIPGEGDVAVPGGPSPDLFLAQVDRSFEIQEQTQLAGQVELNQALLAPQLWFLIPNASRAEKSAALTADGVRRDVLFGVAEAFYSVAGVRQALRASERLLEIAQRQERDARVRLQAGSVARVALLRAEIDRARAEQDLRRARNSYDSARLALAYLLDRGTDFDFEVVDPPDPELPADPATLEEAALRARPDVQAARLQVDVERGFRKAAAARYLPNVGAFARYQISNGAGFTGENDQYAVGLGLSWQLLDGGLRESDLREGSARIAEAEAAAARTESRARLEVRQSLLDLESARANAAKAREQRDLAVENQRLVNVSYRAGAATAVEQADATAALRNAEITATAENLGAQLAALRVLKAAGEFEPVARRRR